MAPPPDFLNSLFNPQNSQKRGPFGAVRNIRPTICAAQLLHAAQPVTIDRNHRSRSPEYAKILHYAFLAILSRQAEPEIFETSEVERTLENQLDVRIGKLVEQVFELGKRGAGKQVLNAYGIEVLDAIPCDAIEAQNPSTKQQLDVVRKYAARRALLANRGANQVRPQPD